jgi:hypothetical protein
MKTSIKISFFIFLICILFYTSCKKEKSCEDCRAGTYQNTVNMLPVAIAGPDQVLILPANSVLLDGSASNDPDGTISKWLWTKISGPSSFTIVNANAAQIQVNNLIEGVYQFELKVTDNGNLFGVDTVKIAVQQNLSHLTEIRYSNLEWLYWHDPNDPGHLFDEIYFWVIDTANAIPDVINPNFSIWVKKDSASIWEMASNTISNGNCTAPFWFNLDPGGVLVELCFPWDLSLVGKKAEVKIFF